MPENKKPEFTVNDRRKFNIEGDVRPDAPAEQVETPVAPPAPKAAEPAKEAPNSHVVSMPMHWEEPGEESTPLPPTAEEQNEQTKFYKERTNALDARLQQELDTRGGGRSVQDFEMNFEKFVASIYMSALMQLGLVHEQGGQPRADIIGARQTIDTLAILADKTKGNLTMQEDNVLRNCLYELRMAYIEVTNSLTHPPSGIVSDPGIGFK